MQLNMVTSVSRFARRKSHHTELTNAAAPNSDCPIEPRRPIPNPHQVMYDVVEKNIDSSSQSNSLSRRRKKLRHEGGGIVVEKRIKSQRIFNKNYCDLLTAITHTKILVAYFIISDKKTEV